MSSIRQTRCKNRSHYYKTFQVSAVVTVMLQWRRVEFTKRISIASKIPDSLSSIPESKAQDSGVRILFFPDSEESGEGFSGYTRLFPFQLQVK